MPHLSRYRFLIYSQLLIIAIAGTEKIFEPDVNEYYGKFESPTFNDTTYEEVRSLLLHGRPFVVEDGARGLPMSSWTCDFVKKEFPDSRIRLEGGKGDTNGVRMDSDWTGMKKEFSGATGFPDGAPKIRPFYWDIAKASQDEKHRKWGKNPEKVVQKLIKSSGVPYFLPKQDSREMGSSSEMWFHPSGAGAMAHMDPHCRTTVSLCFSGRRKWRMMVPPAQPHRSGYFDGEVYGVRDRSRRGEWQPTFEFEAPAGSAVIIYPGMIHESLSVGENCSSSISQTFAMPLAAAYFRAFWPRFALIHEDVGRCGPEVESLVTLGSGGKVKAASEEAARKSGEAFASKVDKDNDGIASEAELLAMVAKGRRTPPLLDELVSFHDTNNDKQVTTSEIAESWVMYATASNRVTQRKKNNEL